MRNRIVYVFLIASLFAGSYIFFKKNYLEQELVCKLPNVRNGEFYPDAYVFFHSQESINRFFELTAETKELNKFIPKDVKFDFDNYSYCIFFGRKVNGMFYSYKTTYFNDPSPSYASSRRYGNKCVFVSYDSILQNGDSGIYLYRVKKDEKLRGFDGL